MAVATATTEGVVRLTLPSMSLALPSPLKQAARSAQPVLVTVLVAIIVVGLSWEAARGRRTPAVLAGGLTLMAAVFWKPRFAALLVILASCFVTSPFVHPMTVLGSHTDMGEALAYSLIVWGLLVVVTNEDGLRAVRGSGPWVLLVIAAAVGSLVGLHRGADHKIVVGFLKDYFVYLLVIPMLVAFRTRQARALLHRAVMTIADVGSVWVILSAMTGGRLRVSSPSIAVETLGVLVPAQRFRPPLLFVLVIATMLLASVAASKGWTPFRLLELTLYVVTWLLSLTRSYWVPLVLALILFLLMRAGIRRPLRSVRVTAVTALVVVVLLPLAASGALGPTTKAAIGRVASIGSSKLSTDPSYLDRVDELHDGVHALEASPIVGVGVAHTYGAKRLRYDPVTNSTYFEDRLWSHNSLLLIYLQTGLLGMAAMVWLAVATTRRGYRARRDLHDEDANTVLVGCLALLALGLMSLSNTHLLFRPAIVGAVIAATLSVPPIDARRRAALPSPSAADAGSAVAPTAEPALG